VRHSTAAAAAAAAAVAAAGLAPVVAVAAVPAVVAMPAAEDAVWTPGGALMALHLAPIVVEVGHAGSACVAAVEAIAIPVADFVVRMGAVAVTAVAVAAAGVAAVARHVVAPLALVLRWLAFPTG
jgi:hypothetical protein